MFVQVLTIDTKVIPAAVAQLRPHWVQVDIVAHGAQVAVAAPLYHQGLVGSVNSEDTCIFDYENLRNRPAEPSYADG